MNIENKHLKKSIFDSTIHAWIQEIFNRFPTILNSIVLSVFSKTLLSATTLVAQFVVIFSYITLGLNLAVSMLSSQYYGKKDYEAIDKIFHVSMLFSLIIGGAFFIISFFTPKVVLVILTNDAELISYGSIYLKYYSFVFLFSAFSKIYMTILKNENRIKVNTIIGTITNVINVLLSVVLVYGIFNGKQLGVKGAGIASSIATFSQCLMLLIYSYTCGKNRFSILRLFKIDIYFLKSIFKYSLPMVATKFAWSTARTIQIALIGHMSRNVIDAYSFVKLYANVTIALIIGYADSCGIHLGHELGKGNLHFAKKLGDDLLKKSILVGAIAACLTFVLGLVSLRISSDMTNTTEIYIMNFCYMFFVFSGAISYCLADGVFTAGGEVEFITLVNVVNMWVIVTPVCLLLFYFFKVPYFITLLVINSIELAKLPFYYPHYKKYVWARDLTKNEWFLPLSGSFLDKYRRGPGLKFQISFSELFTKRFENSTDFVFSINLDNLSNLLAELQKYLININIDALTSYKIVMAIEGLLSSSSEEIKNVEFKSDIGIRVKNDKLRIIYYDNGYNLSNVLKNKDKISIKVLNSICDKIVYKRLLGLNKIILRFDRHI